MAVFTMTQAMVDGLELLYSRNPRLRTSQLRQRRGSPEDQPLDDPRVGNPISRHQIVELWEKLFGLHRQWDVKLEEFMEDSEEVKLEPTPGPEPTEEWKAMMKRLKNEADQKAYEKMIGRQPSSIQFRPQISLAVKKEDMVSNTNNFAEYRQALAMGGSFLLSILGVPSAIYVIALKFLHATMETSLLLAVATFLVITGVELTLFMMNEDRKQAMISRSKEMTKGGRTVVPDLSAFTQKKTEGEKMIIPESQGDRSTVDEGVRKRLPSKNKFRREA